MSTSWIFSLFGFVFSFWLGDYPPKTNSPTTTQPKRKTMYFQHPPFHLIFDRSPHLFQFIRAVTEYCSKTISANTHTFDQNYQNRCGSSGGKRPHRQKTHTPHTKWYMTTFPFVVPTSRHLALTPPHYFPQNSPPNIPNQHPTSPPSKRDDAKKMVEKSVDK